MSLLSPPIQRTPIGSPPVHAFDLPANPSSDRWTLSFRRQIKSARFLALVTTAIMLYLNQQVLTAQGFGIETTYAYMTIYGVMSYFLLWFLSKMVVGAWGIMNNPNLPDHPSRTMCDPDPSSRVAIIFPVYHEDVCRVAAGMAATWESLERHTPDCIGQYDMFLLSDSRRSTFRKAEEAAILELRKLYPSARFFYRWRPTNTHAKIGNVTDFCRRWGKSYKYMFTMDADSVVSGETIHTTLRMMEGRPQVGILQTNPKAVFRKTIFGRMQQFSAHLFGIAFTTTLRATMLGNGTYMGHNAMVRVKPFIEHCMLPTLPGSSPWGGKPLSHDVVESALMAGHGFETWFLPELEGSWEEVPANILASLIRERRWMQGNLQHSRLMNRAIFPSAYKEYFFAGIFAYISAPIWAVFLILSAYASLRFMSGGIIDPDTATLIITNSTLLGIFTFSVFVLLRVISLYAVISNDKSKGYGGTVNLLLSVVIEFIFSMVYAPITMLAMTNFIYMWCRKKSIVWGVQDRGDECLSWVDSFRHFGWMVFVGCFSLAVLVYYSRQIPDQDVGLMMAVSNGLFNPYAWLYWMSPIFCGAIFAPLIARWTSMSSDYFKRIGLFVIPEETDIPAEFTTLQYVESYLQEKIPAY